MRFTNARCFARLIVRGVAGACTALTILAAECPNPPPLSITTDSTLPAGTRMQSYVATLEATGGAGTYTWSVTSGTLQSGLSLGANNGVISGTPTAAGTTTFTVQVSSAGQTNAKVFRLTINHPAVTITTTSPLPDGTRGVPYLDTLRATGGDGVSYNWTVLSGSVPAGLELSAGGVLSGTPTEVVTDTFTVAATSGGQTGTRTLSLTINSKQFTLTVRTAGNGFGTVLNWPPPGFVCVPVYPWVCGAPVDSGMVVTLEARAAPGSVFVGWSGDCTTWLGTSCQVMMDRDRAVIATFDLAQTDSNITSGLPELNRDAVVHRSFTRPRRGVLSSPFRNQFAWLAGVGRR